MKPADRKNKNTFSNFGFTTVLIVFVMICIVTFSALAYLTAASDYRLSKKVADRTTDYYQAEEKAYLVLGEIDSALTGVYGHRMKKDTYLKKSRQALDEYAKDHSVSLLIQDKDTLTVSYRIEVSPQEELIVTLKVCYPPEAEGACLKLTGWQTITELQQESDSE